MKSIYNEKILNGLTSFKKWLLRIAVALLIFAVALGGLVIVIGGSNKDAAILVGRLIGTVVAIGLMMLFTTWDIKLIESKKPSVQILATIGLVFNVLSTIFVSILLWIPELTTCRYGIFCEIPPMLKVTSASYSLSMFGLLCGAIMNIYEGNRKDVILPLKITTAVLLGYEMLFSMVAIMLGGKVNENAAALAGYAAGLWFVLWIVTFIISRNEKKKNKMTPAKTVENAPAPAPVAGPVAEPKPAEPKPAEPKTDDQLRAEIEEQVRREMIEKEVRARIEKEQKKA